VAPSICIKQSRVLKIAFNYKADGDKYRCICRAPIIKRRTGNN